MTNPALRVTSIDDLARTRSVADVQLVTKAIVDDSGAVRRLAMELWTREDLRATRFGTLLPGIALTRGASLPDRCSRRAYNLLMRSGLTTWGHFALSTPASIRAIQSCGAAAFSEICRNAILAWTSLDPSEAVGPPSVATAPSVQSEATGPSPVATVPTLQSESTLRRPWFDEITDDAELLLKWSWENVGAVTLGDALTQWSTLDPPAKVKRAAERLAERRFAPLLGLRDLGEDGWRALLDFSPRERVVLERRILPRDHKPTLEEVGVELGITRERVRQLGVRVRDTMNSRLDGETGAALRHLAARVVQELGPVADAGADVEACEAAVIATSADPGDDFELRRELLRQTCGPYVEIGGLIWSPAARRKLDEVRHALNGIEAGGLIDDSTVDEVHAALAIAPERDEAVLAYLGLKRIEGSVLRWTGSIADKAIGALAAAGRSMSMLDLYDLVETDRNPRSFANAVQTDERVMRLGKDRYGLRQWGGEEYSGILQELEQAIDEAGGAADLEELVARFVAEFEVSESSVRAYASDRRFIRAADGTISFRTGEDPEPTFRTTPVEMARNAVQLGGIWHLRIEVDKDALRGSGRPIRNAVALAVGLEPDLTLGIQYGDDVVVMFSWTSKQPVIGSIRGVLQEHSCVEGDLIFLPLDGDEPRMARVIRAAERNRENGVRRLAIELGLDPDQADHESPGPLASAVGLPAGADYVDVEDRLVDRGENTLAALVPVAS